MVVVHMVLVSYRLYIYIFFFHYLNYFIILGTYAGADGSRKPTDLELKVAEHQGSYFTQVATALKIGHAALPPKDANPPDPKQK
jgi:hypothetical protein